MPLLEHSEAVGDFLLNIFKQLMAAPDFRAFSLAGGTSLALRYGHRTSVDLDLFSTGPFNSLELQDNVFRLFPESRIVNRTQGSLCVVIGKANIDFLHHPYPLLSPVETEGPFRLLSVQDVSAMKINAVTSRGSRKDFIDLYALHEHGISLKDALENFRIKYSGNKFLALRSLVWFEDAENEPEPVMLADWDWGFIKDSVLRWAMEISGPPEGSGLSR